MTHHTMHAVACLLLFTAVTCADKEQTRWSRQISTYTADISDWVPLPAPVEREQPQGKRQAVAEPRILTEPYPGFVRPTAFTQTGSFNQDAFPSKTFYSAPSNRQLYLQSLPSVPSAPQNFLSEQGFGQSIRFGLSQPNFPLNQGFVAPQLSFDTIPQINSQLQQVSLKPIKFENNPKPNQPPKPQVQPFLGQTPKFKPELPKFYDGYRLQNVTNDFNTKRPQSLQKLKFEGQKTETLTQNKPQVEREEVQLLYVPLESLNSGQFNFRSPVATPQIVNSDLFNQIQRQVPLNAPIINNPATDFQKATTKAAENFNLRQEIPSSLNAHVTNVDQVPKFTTLSSPFPTVPPSTSKPKKLKPHQPPLAIFLTHDSKKDNQVKVGDVLYSLKNANTIAVLDAVNPQNAPKVFIGPSSLLPPEKYVKFELPYLSNIENSEKKLRQLPFFVAPLSYNTPQGFAKIPFPSPHVGSVVINSQINKDAGQTTHTTTVPLIPPSFYTYNQSPPRQEQKLETQKPKINYYTTAAPKPKTLPGYDSNYYSFEQQAVNALRTPEKSNTGIKPSSYFLSNIGSQYNPDFVNFPSDTNYHTPEPVQTYSIAPTTRTTPTQRPTTTTTTTTSTTTTTTTTVKPSTYPSQLLETHNPYSINQAFHFSTPIDYQNFFDEYKENYSAPGQNPISQQPTEKNISTPSSSSYPQEKEKTQIKYTQSSPNYLQGYTPEIHYESEVQNSRFNTYNANQQTTESTNRYKQTNNPVVQNQSFEPSSDFTPVIHTETFETNKTPEVQSEYIIPSSDLTPPKNEPEQIEPEPTSPQNNEDNSNNTPLTSYENNIPATGPTYYNQYDTTYNNAEREEAPLTTTTSTTTTTRRAPLRTRGRPRYPTTKADTGEYTTRAVITRRPLRERRPLPNRPRYEPNKITTEKPSRPSTDSVETTTKYKRTRTRGRVHYKPSEADEVYDKRFKAQSSKENDLAYQRDVLHQNYPVTLMERLSTHDIEAITEPTIKISDANVQNSEDTENAYSNDKITVTEHTTITESRNEQHEYTDTVPNDSYIPNLPYTHNNENSYQSKSSFAPVATLPAYEEVKTDDVYTKLTTPVQSADILEVTTQSVDENIRAESEHSISVSSSPDFINEEEVTTKNIENINTENQEETQTTVQEENIIQTTPSYNRVRVRPGVIRQYHQASTESSRVRLERRRPGQGITYRPAYDRRRTTMRIDEIEADLKTKQVHSRPEFQDFKHPVYKPEPVTEPTGTPSSTQEGSTRRGTYRRRRPTYSVSSTEAPTNKKTYEIKNRFRGRRPTDKPETQTEPTTVRDAPVAKYNDGPRLSERYNQNPEPEEAEDQDPNYSIQRPSYATPDSNRWSPKITADYFKPYNPNDIVDEPKALGVDNQSDNGPELDIITAKNEYDNILISVTPATNNRGNKKIPDIPPTLEALVEQSRITKSEGGDTMSTFESMLEEVMKSLEEQDEDEYTKNVMKHKGGEIGEIPPEKIITNEENFYSRATTPLQEITTPTTPYEESEEITEKETNRKQHRRGFWKKVKVRPSTTESIEAAESQYYSNTVNRLGHAVSKTRPDKYDKNGKSKLAATTYKPALQFIKEFFNTDNEEKEITPFIDIPKITTIKSDDLKTTTQVDSLKTTVGYTATETPTERFNPGEMDLGTGSPDSTFSETYYSTATEPIPTISHHTTVDRSDGFNLMDYFFGVTSADTDTYNKVKNETKRDETEVLKADNDLDETSTTEQQKLKPTTETTYIPEEITTYNKEENNGNDYNTNETAVTKVDIEYSVEQSTQNPPKHIETSSVSSFMDSLKVVSTSMSTEVSHETEICFRGKCIKTNKSLS